MNPQLKHKLILNILGYASLSTALNFATHGKAIFIIFDILALALFVRSLLIKVKKD